MAERESQSDFAWVRDLPIVGTPLGDLFGIDDPAEVDLRNKMRAAAEDYERYRGQSAAAQMQGLQQALSLFDPLNIALGGMYGPQAQFSFGDVFQDPTAAMREVPPTPERPPDIQRLHPFATGEMQPTHPFAEGGPDQRPHPLVKQGR